MTVRVAMLAGAAVLALASVPASAQSQGPYVGIGGGMSWLEDADVNGAGAITELSFDPGWAAIIKGGYALGNGFRPELRDRRPRLSMSMVPMAAQRPAAMPTCTPPLPT